MAVVNGDNQPGFYYMSYHHPEAFPTTSCNLSPYSVDYTNNSKLKVIYHL